MQSKQLRIVFFGSSKHVIPIIEVLAKNFDLALVVTTENRTSQSETLEPPVINYCIQHKLSYLSPQQFNNLTIQQLKKSNPSVGFLASFGAIIPSEVLNLFPHGIINIHPSLLPKYRGPTPVQTAILNGEKVTGVSIIKLDDEIDHGPILSQVKEPILDNDTSESLYERLFRLSSSSIVSTIELFLKEEITSQEQDHSKATFTKRLARQDGYVDLNNPPSKERFNRMIRAYYPWPDVWSKWKMENGKWKIIKFLPDKKIQMEGKKPVDIETFKRGYPDSINLLEKLLGQHK